MKARWLALAALPLALAAAVLATQWAAIGLGNSAWRSGDAAAAESHYSTAMGVPLVERWVAPYNLGVARHGLGRFDDAAADFALAAERAPVAQQCRVLLNWSWTLEASGDARASGDPQGARTRYLEADAVLAGAHCPDETPPDSKEPSQQEQLEQTRERLESKRTGTPPPAEEPPLDDDPADTRADELQQRQREAQRQFWESGEQTNDEPPPEGTRTW